MDADDDELTYDMLDLAASCGTNQVDLEWLPSRILKERRNQKKKQPKQGDFVQT
jgi:hypothetical protein